jgi:hypothetical protein
VTASALLVAVVAVLDDSSPIGPAIGAAGIVVGYLSLPRLLTPAVARRHSAGAAA